MEDDDENNDLASYDSDPETPSTRPTAISTHPSQIGYLTTSSPLVQAAHHPESQASDTQTSESSLRSSTFHQESFDSLDSAPSLTRSNTGLPLPHSQAKRVPSVSRLRGVFRSKTGSEKSSSPDRSARTTASDSKPEVAAPSSLKLDSAEPPKQPISIQTDATKVASSERARRLSLGRKIDTTRPPQTPPSAESATPVIVNTPPTPTDPNFNDRPETPTASPRSNASTTSPGSMISQRRRAGSGAIGPSKLSNITPAPLTPTPESGPGTPSNNSTANFFSSMFSAVQNTANTLTNTISNANLGQGGSKSKFPVFPDQGGRDQEDSVEVESSAEAQPQQSMETKELAVRTLGQGDLSLSQLGIMETGSNAPTPVTAKFAESETRARSESAPVDAHTAELPLEVTHVSRPRSLNEAGGSGDRTPPQGSEHDGKSGIQRTGSIRSAIGKRRKRGSTGGTGTTGTTVAAAIAAANASVANPHSSIPKLTGFAVASQKRNRDFHTLFKSVPDDDYLIEDYSCALQREILAHGRLYVSEGYLCFSSNIMGWVTTLVMSFDEIVSVEKRSTALIFKNGLEISTLHAKHIFASLASRDTTYDLIVKIWKLGHPQLRSSLNGVHLEETGGDRTEKIETDTASVTGSHSASGSDGDDSDDGDDVYDEDEDNEDGYDTAQQSDVPALEAAAERAVARKASGAVAAAGTTEKQDEGAASSSGGDFAGPATHAPTDCGDADSHYDKVLGDDAVPAPLGKVFNLLFGAGSAAWMGKWLTVDQKCFDLQMEDKRGLSDEVKTRTYSYIKPLSGSIGPRQTKCIVTEQLEHLDFEKAVNILVSTQNPDVPSGNVFSVKTRYCLSWAENNATRVQINCTIEWTGKSWIKGAIERGANDGQIQYCKDLFAGLKAAVSSRPRSGMLANGAAPKGKKKGRKGKAAQLSRPESDTEGLAKVSTKQDWGLFEPARPFLGPVVDTIKPILTGNVVYGLLVGLLVATWFGFGTNRQAAVPYGLRADLGYAGYPQRVAAYEEMWRMEESDMWNWIEERTGMDRLSTGMPLPTRKKVVDPRTVEEKLREEKMDERELQEAIRVTEEHLQVLKSVVDKRQ
ncbi:hypothetical protein QBC46DRAFT_386839 [Diplogelasinospora grovesii]|uniref:VASt domain-containing protein n=1 Tax=Diplogelasinospora grovesii TaxID=303347 RepID=A0AAN6S485_9PEZI|nr:hypothetical protein QBC46DRAFT_386839 [Diplogelasinospora grovesii]